MTLIVVYLLREVSDFGNFSTNTGSTLAETTNYRDHELEGSQISEESTAVPYGANFLLVPTWFHFRWQHFIWLIDRR